MAILSITVSVEDKKLLYIKKYEEEGEYKFSCHHFAFDADNQAEVTLDAKGIIKSIAPYRKNTSLETTTLSSSRSVALNNISDLKLIKNSSGSVVIIDVESFLIREDSSDTPDVGDLVTPLEELKEKLIISIGKREEDLKDLKFHVEKLVPELA